MLANVLLAVAGVLILFVFAVATRSSAYFVKRTLYVAASAEHVFDVVNDLRQFAGVLVLFGSPWETQDPNMQKNFAGPAAGVGQSLAWKGSKAGTGTMTIDESVPFQKVRITLQFVKPMESTATYVLTIAEAPNGSSVTWSIAGNHNFIGKAFGLLMNMDRMLGADIEKGLTQLKTVAEATQAASFPLRSHGHSGR